MRESITENEAYEQYDEMLDEVSGEVRIGSLTYSASQVLKEVDPTAYRCGFNDWIDAEGWEYGDDGDLYRGEEDEEEEDAC